MPPGRKKKIKWLPPPSLKEMEVINSDDLGVEFKKLSDDMLNNLISVVEYAQDCKEELEQAVIDLQQECKQQNGSLLMPKSPAPKRARRGRPKKESLAVIADSESDLHPAARRSNRNASRTAAKKITSNVEDFDLSKKKRRPTNNSRNIEFIDESSQEPPVRNIGEEMESETNKNTTEEVGMPAESCDEVIVTESICNGVMDVEVDNSLADVEDNGGQENTNKRKSVRRTRQTLTKSNTSIRKTLTRIVTSSEDEVPKKKLRVSASVGPVPATRNSPAPTARNSPAPTVRNSPAPAARNSPAIVHQSPVPAPRAARVSKSSKKEESASTESGDTADDNEQAVSSKEEGKETADSKEEHTESSHEDEVMAVTSKEEEDNTTASSKEEELVISGTEDKENTASSNEDEREAPTDKEGEADSNNEEQVNNSQQDEMDEGGADKDEQGPLNSTFSAEKLQQAPRFSVGAGEPIEKNTEGQSPDSLDKQSGAAQEESIPVIELSSNNVDEASTASISSEEYESANESNDKSTNKGKQKASKAMETSTRSTRGTSKKTVNETTEVEKSCVADEESSASGSQEEETPAHSRTTKQMQNLSKSDSESTDQSTKATADKSDHESDNKDSEKEEDTGASSSESQKEQVVIQDPPKRSTRTKVRAEQEQVAAHIVVPQAVPVQEPPKRSTRTKQRNLEATQSSSEIDSAVEEVANSAEQLPKRSTRTKQKNAEPVKQPEPVEELPKRSTRTKQRLPDTDEESSGPPAKRTTRTKTKQLISESSEGSDRELTKSTASPRVKELALKAASSKSPVKKGATAATGSGFKGSPIANRVQMFEQQMKVSAGLKTKDPSKRSLSNKIGKQSDKDPLRQSLSGKMKQSTRKSSLGKKLAQVSSATGLSVAGVLQDQDVKQKTPEKRPKLIRAGSNLTGNRPGNVSRTGRPKVLASGGRGVSPAVFSGSGNSSSSAHHKMRSRIDIANKAVAGGPSNMTVKPGLTGMATWQNTKHKGPTLEEIQEAKEEEMKRKQEKEEEALKRRDEMLKKAAEDKKKKNEEKMRKVLEAKKQQEMKDQAKKTNKAKEAEDKALKKKEERLKEEAELKRRKEEAKMKEIEERRRKEEEERLARIEEMRLEEQETKRRQKEEEIKKARKMEEKKRLELMKRKEIERIEREREEMKKIKERERLEKLQQLEKAREAAKKQAEADLNSTYEVQETNKANTTQTINSTFNTTAPVNKTLNSTKNVDSYNMTPARHELPPEPSKSADDYGLDDLKSDEGTDDEENPRKTIPKWALGAELRSALLKQHYMCPDLRMIFCNEIQNPDLAIMFRKVKSRFYKRTSSMHWSSPPRVFN